MRLHAERCPVEMKWGLCGCLGGLIWVIPLEGGGNIRLHDPVGLVALIQEPKTEGPQGFGCSSSGSVMFALWPQGHPVVSWELPAGSLRAGLAY